MHQEHEEQLVMGEMNGYLAVFGLEGVGIVCGFGIGGGGMRFSIQFLMRGCRGVEYNPPATPRKAGEIAPPAAAYWRQWDAMRG